MDLYYETLEKECEPLGYRVNPQIAIACPFLCLKDDQKALNIGAENYGFFVYAWATTVSLEHMYRAAATFGTNLKPHRRNSRFPKAAHRIVLEILIACAASSVSSRQSASIR